MGKVKGGGRGEKEENGGKGGRLEGRSREEVDEADGTAVAVAVAAVVERLVVAGCLE